MADGLHVEHGPSSQL